MNTGNLKSYLLLFVCSFCSCFMTKKEAISLHGKIAANFYDSLYVFDNSDKSIVRFRIKGKDFNYGGFRWINKIDGLVGVEYFTSERNGIDRSNLVCINLKGKVTKTIYKAKQGEIAGYAYLSRKDKKLLFAIERKGDIKLNPLEGLNREKSIQILDLEN
jgi:hypothetical protein